MKKYTSKAVRPIEFELDGVVFTASGPLPVMRLSELMARGEESEGANFLASIAETFRGMLGEADYQRFRAHVAEHGTDPETLAEIMTDVMEARSGGVPLEQPATSPAGTASTPYMSKVISSSGETRWEELSPEKVARLEEAVRRAS